MVNSFDMSDAPFVVCWVCLGLAALAAVCLVRVMEGASGFRAGGLLLVGMVPP